MLHIDTYSICIYFMQFSIYRFYDQLTQVPFCISVSEVLFPRRRFCTWTNRQNQGGLGHHSVCMAAVCLSRCKRTNISLMPNRCSYSSSYLEASVDHMTSHRRNLRCHPNRGFVRSLGRSIKTIHTMWTLIWLWISPVWSWNVALRCLRCP